MEITLFRKSSASEAVDYFRTKLEFETTPHTLKEDMEKGGVYILDVRDKDAFMKERIAGAQNIPLSELPQNYRALPKDKIIVCYCWDLTCFLAPKAAMELAQKGFRVQHLIGGIEEWKKKGFSVERK